MSLQPSTISASTFLEDPALMEPFSHVANLPTKNIRGYFVDAIANHLLEISDDINDDDQQKQKQNGKSKKPTKFLSTLQEAMAILHTASLMFDDIEDGTKMRRGEPAAHVIFGMPLTLNAASAATSAALEVMVKNDLEDEEQKEVQQQQEENVDETDLLPIAPSPTRDGESATQNHHHYNHRQQSQIPLSAVSNSFSLRLTTTTTTPNGVQDLQKEEKQQQEEEAEKEEQEERELYSLRRAALSGRLTRVFIDNMKLLHSGQGKDIYWRGIHQCPSLPEYRLMARQKTGGLFRLVAMWALEIKEFEKNMMQKQTCTEERKIEQERNSLLLTLCDDFGLCFQILDDVANLCDEKLHAMKSFADDLDEGKFSYPAIHCILAGQKKTPAPDKRLLHALVSTTNKKSDAEKEFCVNLMKESGSIKSSCEEILNLCQSLKERTIKIVDELSVSTTKSSGRLKSKMILLTLIERMAERAQKFSS
jgi:geranylgeranyl pyrophosphate synthase